MNTRRSLSLPSSLTKRLSSFSFFYPAKKLKNEPTKESTFSLKKFHHILFSRTKKNRAFVHTHASNEPTRDDRLWTSRRGNGRALHFFTRFVVDLSRSSIAKRRFSSTMTVFDVFAATSSPTKETNTGEDGGEIKDCRVGFECANDRAGGRNSESDDSSNERLTPPLSAFVESPIKKMLLKELIEAHEKEREDNDESAFGNLEKVDSSKKKKSPKKKKTNGFAENAPHELDDEEDDATLRSTSSTEQCFESTALYRNFSEPIPIPVADVQLRCVFRSRLKRASFPPFLSLFFFLTSFKRVVVDIFVVKKRFLSEPILCDGKKTPSKSVSFDLISLFFSLLFSHKKKAKKKKRRRDVFDDV